MKKIGEDPSQKLGKDPIRKRIDVKKPVVSLSMDDPIS